MGQAKIDMGHGRFQSQVEGRIVKEGRMGDVVNLGRLGDVADVVLCFSLRVT